MRNVTVSLPDDVYRRARVRAAEQDTSVSALVKGFLMELGSGESEFDRRKRLQAEVLAEVQSFSARDRLPRSDIHRA